MALAKLCILTPALGYEERWQGEGAPLDALFGDQLTYRCWADTGDLADFDLILPLLAWGYPRHAARWYATLDAWEAAALPFANPLATLRWNTDKDYLLDLQAAGVAIVETLEAHNLCAADLEAARSQFGSSILVVKPSISGGADGTYKLGPNDPIPFDVLEREMLIQPMMPSIADEGEFSLFYFGGSLSHAILKRPAAGDFRVQEQYGGHEVSVKAPSAGRMLAQAALAAAPAPPLYARVDMVRDGQGAFRLMELELIEPSLFLAHAPDGGAMLAEAVRARLG